MLCSDVHDIVYALSSCTLTHQCAGMPLFLLCSDICTQTREKLLHFATYRLSCQKDAGGVAKFLSGLTEQLRVKKRRIVWTF